MLFTLSTTFLPDVRIYAILHYLCHIMQCPSMVPFYIAPYQLSRLSYPPLITSRSVLHCLPHPLPYATFSQLIHTFSHIQPIQACRQVLGLPHTVLCPTMISYTMLLYIIISHLSPSCSLSPMLHTYSILPSLPSFVCITTINHLLPRFLYPSYLPNIFPCPPHFAGSGASYSGPEWLRLLLTCLARPQAILYGLQYLPHLPSSPVYTAHNTQAVSTTPSGQAAGTIHGGQHLCCLWPPPHLLGPLGLISYITCTARPLYSAGLRKLPILFIPLVLAPPNTDYVAVTCPLHAEMTLLTASMPPPPHCNLHIFVARILLIVLIVLRYQYIDSAGTIAVCSRPDIGIAANTPSALRPTSLGGPIICP